MFKGILTAIVTPFRNNKVDYDSFGKLIEWQIAQGVTGIVPCGSTGESATLSFEEHKEVIGFTVKTVKKRVLVIAGTGSNNTEEAVELTQDAEQAGADAALLITPYYNKPTQEGLYRHFKVIAEKTKLPLVLYNVPGRTGVNMLPATIARCAEMKNIVAVKEASGSLEQACDIIQMTSGKVDVLSGDDSLFLPILAVGGTGVICTTSNVTPADMCLLYEAFMRGDLQEARRVHYKLFGLMKALFLETNPIPVKTALSLMGKMTGEMRLPLCAMQDANLEKLKKEMKTLGLI
jgi:4-hydroxy-tetrahydrodipicolinate synthase